MAATSTTELWEGTPGQRACFMAVEKALAALTGSGVVAEPYVAIAMHLAPNHLAFSSAGAGNNPNDE